MMEIKNIQVSQIKPAHYNPRLDLKPGDPDYEKLKKSMLEFDLVEPLVWNKRSGNLIGGHQRLKILIEQGAETVDVSVVDLPDRKEKALNLALNKISGDWDTPRLRDILEELDVGDFDTEITGFDGKEIENLMTQFYVPEEGLTDDDEIPEKVETVCKSGDLWQLGNHRLYVGDCTIKANVERLMGGEKADMVFTDPPYGINIVRGVTATNGGSKPFGRMRQRGGKPSGVVGGKGLVEPRLYHPVIGDDKPFEPIFLLNLAPIIILFGANCYASRLPDSLGWLVWDKGVSPDATFSACELIWTNKGNHIKRYEHRWSGMVRAGNRKEELKDRVHPTQKPVGLCFQILQDYKANNILDLYGGSGSILIACEKLDRRCFMMEISPEYCDVIRTRWEAFTGKQAVKLG